MNKVVIVDVNGEMLQNYARMLEACQTEFECKYFKYPEEAVEYIRREEVAVLVCELEMPVMSGKEVFDMVEMISPATVKIAMSQVKDVQRTLEIMNQSRIFKLILKPFFFPEDMIEPVKAALKYYELREREKNRTRREKVRIETPNQQTRRLVTELEQEKQTRDNLCKIMTGMLNGNLRIGKNMLSEEEQNEIVRIYERMLREFMQYCTFGTQNYIFHVNYLMNHFNRPEEKRQFVLKNRKSQNIPNEIFQEMAYTIVTAGCIFTELFEKYQVKAIVEEKNGEYILQLMWRGSRKNEMDKNVVRIMLHIIEEMMHIFSTRVVMEGEGKLPAFKIYYKKGEVSDE